jgi:hypothetical protein
VDVAAPWHYSRRPRATGWASYLWRRQVIGFLAGLIAFILYNLIGLFTNVAFYQRVVLHFRSPEANQLGPWVIVIPVVGGLIVGVMAKYGWRLGNRHP